MDETQLDYSAQLNLTIAPVSIETMMMEGDDMTSPNLQLGEQ